MVKAIILFLLIDISFCQSKWIKTYGADELDGANHILTLDDGYLISSIKLISTIRFNPFALTKRNID
jgi:hypothetical protein